ncbi:MULTISPECIES: hypothetical protein [Bacillus]|uniref:hypothetical protein n=1 Tax=Bacillus TaxID=1386 RepID=UPI0002EF66F8|nr:MULTISPECIES: hypothetical protein [Bacillus]
MCLCNNIIQSAMAIERQKELEKQKRLSDTNTKPSVSEWLSTLKARMIIPKD